MLNQRRDERGAAVVDDIATGRLFEGVDGRTCFPGGDGGVGPWRARELSTADDLGGGIEHLGTGLCGIGRPIRDEPLGQGAAKHDAVDGLGEVAHIAIDVFALVPIGPIHLTIGSGHEAVGTELQLDFEFAHTALSYLLSFALPVGKERHHFGDALCSHIWVAFRAVDPAKVLFPIKRW